MRLLGVLLCFPSIDGRIEVISMISLIIERGLQVATIMRFCIYGLLNNSSP